MQSNAIGLMTNSEKKAYEALLVTENTNIPSQEATSSKHSFYEAIAQKKKL